MKYRIMKLKSGFISHITDKEAILVPTSSSEFSGVVRGNKTFGAILELLKDDTDEEKIIAALGKRFDAPEELIASDVRRALSELARVGAIEE